MLSSALLALMVTCRAITAESELYGKLEEEKKQIVEEVWFGTGELV